MTTNSPVSSISLCEYLWGPTLIATIGGLKEVGMVQARVMALALPSLSQHVTITTCLGCRSLVAKLMASLFTYTTPTSPLGWGVKRL